MINSQYYYVINGGVQKLYTSFTLKYVYENSLLIL